MRSIWNIALLALGVSVASVAKADMSCAPLCQGTYAVATAAPAFPADLFDGVESGLAEASQPGAVIPDLPQAQASRTGTAAGLAVDIPAPPSSAELFLWALGSFGATMAGRSAGKLHLSDVPPWFHAGGPDQIGHACRIDLDVRVPAISQFDKPADDRIICRFIKLMPRFWAKPQYRIAATETRGPPPHCAIL